MRNVTRRTLLKAIAASPFATMMWPLRAQGAYVTGDTRPDEANVDVTETQSGAGADWTKFEVTGLDGAEPDTSIFLGGSDAGAYCVPMNVNTEVQDPDPVKPGNGQLNGKAHKDKGGIVGAKVGATLADEPGLKAILAASDGLWTNEWGGPYAIDRAESYQSYLLSAPDLVTPANVQQWIDLLGQCRIEWLDWTHCFRYGDYMPWTTWPTVVAADYDDVSAVLATLTAAGINSILHNYSHYIIEGSTINGDTVDAGHADVISGDLVESTNTIHARTAYYPVTDVLAEEVGDNIVTVADLGFKGLYFDALNWTLEVDAANPWWPAQKLLNYVGTNLLNPDILVETSWVKTATWNVLSRRGTQDQGAEGIRDFGDRILSEFLTLRPDWGIPLTLGWFKAQAGDSDADINYVLDLAEDNNAGFSWRDLAPSVWSDAGMMRLARLIGNRTPVQRTKLSSMGMPIRET